MTFHRFVPDGESVIAVDRVALARGSKAHSHCIVVRFDFSPAVSKVRGLTPAQIPEAYYEFESALMRKRGGTRATLIGTMTGRAERKAWFFSEQADLLDRVRAMADRFTGLPVAAAAASASDLETLTPTAAELQIMRDMQRVMDLQARGDDPERERLIEHLILDVAEADRDILARELQAMGYAVAGPEGEMIRFSVRGRTDIASVRKRTESLIRLCQAFNCHYEGWGAPVIN